MSSYLPQAKHLVVDAKVSLNAYTRYVNAVDEAERAQALREHRGHRQSHP
jgi:DNA recombination protein RmuC